MQRLSLADEAYVEEFKRAVTILRSIQELGIHARIYATRNVGVHLDLRGHAHNTIYELAKKLSTRFDKDRSVCGFLRYIGYKNGIKITANTQECFTGGTLVIERRPRTHAYCLITKE